MAILYYLPDAENLRKNKDIKFLDAPPRLHDIGISDLLTKDDPACTY